MTDVIQGRLVIHIRTEKQSQPVQIGDCLWNLEYSSSNENGYKHHDIVLVCSHVTDDYEFYIVEVECLDNVIFRRQKRRIHCGNGRKCHLKTSEYRDQSGTSGRCHSIAVVVRILFCAGKSKMFTQPSDILDAQVSVGSVTFLVNQAYLETVSPEFTQFFAKGNEESLSEYEPDAFHEFLLSLHPLYPPFWISDAHIVGVAVLAQRFKVAVLLRKCVNILRTTTGVIFIDKLKAAIKLRDSELKNYLMVNLDRSQSEQLLESELLKNDKELMRDLLGNLHSIADVSVAPTALHDPTPQNGDCQRVSWTEEGFVTVKFHGCDRSMQELRSREVRIGPYAWTLSASGTETDFKEPRGVKVLLYCAPVEHYGASDTFDLTIIDGCERVLAEKRDADFSETFDFEISLYRECESNITARVSVKTNEPTSNSLPALLISDVNFKVAETTYPANRAYMSYVSPFFHRMFTSDFAEKRSDEITLSGVTNAEFEAFMDAVTGVTKPLQGGLVAQLLRLADMYQVDVLQAKCVNHLRAASDLDLAEKLLTAQQHSLEETKTYLLSLATIDELAGLAASDKFIELHSTTIEEIIRHQVQHSGTSKRKKCHVYFGENWQ